MKGVLSKAGECSVPTLATTMFIWSWVSADKVPNILKEKPHYPSTYRAKPAFAAGDKRPIAAGIIILLFSSHWTVFEFSSSILPSRSVYHFASRRVAIFVVGGIFILYTHVICVVRGHFMGRGSFYSAKVLSSNL